MKLPKATWYTYEVEKSVEVNAEEMVNTTKPVSDYNEMKCVMVNGMEMQGWHHV